MINIFILFCKKDKTILLTLKYTSEFQFGA